MNMHDVIMSNQVKVDARGRGIEMITIELDSWSL